MKLTLVDFGFATRYMDHKTNEHKPQKQINCFRGNLLFSSKNLLEFQQPSRRDDMISFFFMMVYLLNKCNFPGIDWLETASYNWKQNFLMVKELKTKNDLISFCKGESALFLDIAMEIQKLEYTSKPNYDKIRYLLNELIHKEKKIEFESRFKTISEF